MSYLILASAHIHFKVNVENNLDFFLATCMYLVHSETLLCAPHDPRTVSFLVCEKCSKKIQQSLNKVPACLCPYGAELGKLQLQLEILVYTRWG